MKKEILTKSLENYLRAVYEIVEENQAARVKDVANYLGIGAPSTSEAIKTLAEKKYINYEPYGIITLTKKGRLKAEQKIERHRIISSFLKEVLLVDESMVTENTEQFEYNVSEDVLEKFVKFLTFMQKCSCKEPKWVKSYRHYAKTGELQNKCKVCVENHENFDNSSCCSGCI